MKLTTTAAILSGCGLIATLYVAKSTMPDSAIDLPFDDTISTAAFAPQGWSFFTRDPREPQLTMWTEDRGAWVRLDSGSNASPENLLGLQRTSRAEAIRAASITGELDDRAISPTECEPAGPNLASAVSACAAGLEVAQLDRSNVPDWDLCGTIALVAQEPLPWAWAAAGVEEEMPFRVSLVDVDCGAGA